MDSTLIELFAQIAQVGVPGLLIAVIYFLNLERVKERTLLRKENADLRESLTKCLNEKTDIFKGQLVDMMSK